MSTTTEGGLLASYKHLDSTVDTIKALRKAGFKKITTFSPFPDHHIEEALGYDQSPVRVFTLAGAMTGAAAGFAFTSWTSMDWPLVTGGKPILSMPAYVIIAFELAVLFGVLSTLIGLFINMKLPRIRSIVVYDPEFSAGRFGVYVTAPPGKIGEVRQILDAQSPTEIREDPEGVAHG